MSTGFIVFLILIFTRMYLEFQYLFSYILILLAMALIMLSMNNLGLGDLATRIDVFFNYLRNMNCSIYCLQDTHFQNIRESYLRAQWVYECVID